ATFKSRAALPLENLALRHQLGVLQRSVKRPKLAPPDRLLWVWLCVVWSGWRSALIIVKPNTVIACHRRCFRLVWSWKIRRCRPGRPAVSKNVRELIWSDLVKLSGTRFWVFVFCTLASHVPAGAARRDDHLAGTAHSRQGRAVVGRGGANP